MSLTYQNITLQSADLGPVNPLPDLSAGGDIHAHIPLGKTISPEEGQYMGWGKVYGIAPYPLQDSYDRDRKPREYPAVILENDYLKAVFLPTLGGRLWQLWDKKKERDLLFTNPILQPGNLGLRNAWFAGGVEFNIGMTGHTPFTCAPLFTTTWKRPDGTEVLRMYEFERIRQVTYRIDALLPEDSRFLFLSIEIVNTRDEEVPIYWWSNIAVEETPQTRVIVPAAKAFHWGYEGVLEKQSVPVTESEKVDLSYSMNASYSLDLFFDIVPPQRPFIATLDEKGGGLIQCSTRRLIGRKLFMWGTGSGGNRWQEHLCGPGRRYLEIQAGLAHTQLECLPLPAGARWSWLEAYGAMDADPSVIHGDNYPAAWKLVDEKLDACLPMEQLDQLLEALSAESPKGLAPKTMGSGWAALEERRRGTNLNDELSFDGSLSDEQAPWLALLERGAFPCPDTNAIPCDWQTQADWLPLLEKARPGSNHWYTHLHLGMLHFAQGDWASARAHWAASAVLTPSAWAWRNLARLDMLENKSEAAEHYKEALRLLPGQRHLTLEGVAALIERKDYAGAWEILSAVPAELASLGRLRLMKARTLLGLGRPQEAIDILTDDTLTIADYREGEDSLTGLWNEAVCDLTGLPLDEALQQMPLPAHLDFRMRT